MNILPKPIKFEMLSWAELQYAPSGYYQAIQHKNMDNLGIISTCCNSLFFVFIHDQGMSIYDWKSGLSNWRSEKFRRLKRDEVIQLSNVS